MATRGFTGKRRSDSAAGRVPPGQYVTEDFPVLSAGPTPRTALDRWSFSLLAPDGSELLRRSKLRVFVKSGHGLVERTAQVEKHAGAGRAVVPPAAQRLCRAFDCLHTRA